MAAAICRIEKRNGIDVALNEDGSVNQVYESALDSGFDNKTALNLYLVSELPSFKKINSTNINLSTFDQQDGVAEVLVGKEKDRWGRSQVWRERIENAGDILRELSGRGNNPDVRYLYEKIEKIKTWLLKDKGFDELPKNIETLEDVEKSSIRFSSVVDGKEYLEKFHNDVLEETVAAYEQIIVQTQEEQVVKDFILTLLQGAKSSIYSKLREVEDIVDKIKKQGKLKSTLINSKQDNENTKATLDSVLKYANEFALPNANLSSEELFELNSTLQKTNQKLSTYVRSVQDPEMRLKIQSFIDQGGEVSTVKENSTTYENENGERVTREQIEREIVESITDFTSEQAVENAVLALPYTEYVESYLSSKGMREGLLNRVKEFQRIPAVSVDNDQLVLESRRKTVLSNTIQVGLSPVGIRSIKRIVQDISPDVWKDNSELVRLLVQDLEQEYVNLGLDVIGLKDTVIDQDSLEVFIDVTEKMLKNPTEQNQQMYLEELEALLPQEFSDPVINTPTEHKGKTLVYFDSNLSNTEIFDKYKLFPVQDKIYHKIDNSLTDNDVLETFYNRMINSEIILPQGYQTVQDPMNIENKLNVMADIRVYLTEYKGRVVSEQNNVLASGVELLMNYKPIAVKNVSNVKTDPEYLKTTFVSDFNKYILQEKLNNSLIYREVLSNFYVGNSDIILKYPVQTIEDIKFQEELEDYIRIKRDSSMDYLLPTGLNLATEDVQTLNDPTKVSPFPQLSVREGDYVMIPVSPSMYYRSGNSLYRKVKEDSSVSLYSKLKTQESPLYFDTNTNFSVSKTEVNDVFKRLSKLQQLQKGKKTFDLKPSILKNQVKLLSLYSEKEKREIDNKTDKCG